MIEKREGKGREGEERGFYRRNILVNRVKRISKDLVVLVDLLKEILILTHFI